MNTIDLAIAPLTAVRFGDGRPVPAGETDFGLGRFPPSPRTVQGLVRTTLLRSVPGLKLGRNADQSRIEALVGPPERLPPEWQIRGPWPACWADDDDPLGPARRIQPWLPAPGWLVRNRRGRLKHLHLRATPDLRADRKPPPFLLVGEGGPARAWLSPKAARSVLQGRLPGEDEPVALDLPPFVRREPHTGLQLAPATRSAVEGMLYTVDFHRFRERSGLVVRLSARLPPEMDPRALTSGAASLGAKNRVARLVPVDSWDDDFEWLTRADHLREEPADGARFLVWATTPVFARDPLAPGFDRLARDAVRIEVLAAAVGAPEPIGGFSMARGRGGRVRRYLPAGAAWLVKLHGGDGLARRRLLRTIHDACVLGDDADERSFGFGHALVALPPSSWSHA